jgi:hypothetical protein
MLGFGATGQFAIGEVGVSTETVSVDKWYVQLSEPVRFRLGLKPAAQQFAALSDPFPFVPFSWFNELVIPAIRTRPGLRPGAQQFIALQPAPSPFVATGWFEALSEPARFRQGLRPPWQQFAAAPTQLRPNPAISAALNALETKDVFLGALLEFIRATSGEVGISLANSPPAEIGAGVAPISGAQVAIFTL